MLNHLDCLDVFSKSYIIPEILKVNLFPISVLSNTKLKLNASDCCVWVKFHHGLKVFIKLNLEENLVYYYDY